MPPVIRPLPVLQHWDCHQSGTCCKEYEVRLSEDEVKRIEAQGWDPQADLGGLEPFRRKGPFWNRRVHLNHRADGSCVFLSEQGRCRIHERFGFETKPLPCRLFPFVLVPVADHWRISVRFACPSAARSMGRAVPEYESDLKEFAAQLAEREHLTPRPDGSLVRPPRLQTNQVVEWPDLLRVVQTLLDILRNQRDPLELRLRKCLSLAGQVRQCRLDTIRDQRLGELLSVLQITAGQETPANPHSLPAPGWVGQVLFRQIASLFLRKDHGPNRGEPQRRGRLGLLAAAWKFAVGKGPVPRLHGIIPETTFEQLEMPRGPLPAAAEDVLERYYTIKVHSLQFCGPALYGMYFWEGFELLALTFPVLLWAARMFRDLPPEEGIYRALTIVDDHFGFNPMLGTLRQRFALRILSRTSELPRLIAWYSR
jgi:lysine-N-methylase